MSAILTSKLYKYTSRKSKILAAVQDPVNTELVQQLDEYITNDEDTEIEDTSDTTPFDDTSDTFLDADETEENSNDSDVFEELDSFDEDTYSEDIDVDSIRSMLEDSEDTKGIARINLKDDELWIYYKDNINLNSIMEPVINMIDSSQYSNLSFNRLARTDNAIVFENQSEVNDE